MRVIRTHATPRREPPSQLKLIPWDVPTPPRGAPKYSLPSAPRPLLLPSKPNRTRSYTLESSTTPSSSDTPSKEAEWRGRREVVRGTTESALVSLARTTAQDQQKQEPMKQENQRTQHGQHGQHDQHGQPSGDVKVWRGRDRDTKVAPWLRTSRLAEEDVERAVRGLTAPRGAVTTR